MSTRLSPVVSEFETEEQAASYDRWFRAKVQASLDNPGPGIPHDQAMALVQAALDERRSARTKRSLD
ncbi:type II toxin-antitoxin system RelB family antitoxin [Pseudomonas gingeri]|uniref:Stability determinant n=1 Tax=Pseudomonas gingeri TaxID=117681 RepID=A0A7Y7Y9U2_9PSED|nr:stability determinant [Pseudomonas gingeri]NVZ67353.1 stability determinant [Pseudomonas gingeri]NWA02493.1 stability determinant [Pseudomonas gingeri]NWA12334.1 stability determinant [Pseudomonas gingeri]NWA57260.1 stability determinant [Pseudomonas gingeri]NWA93603.1 stability determinant [Pseudomonas gingeri]